MASIAITLNLLHKDATAQLALEWRRENSAVIEAASRRHDEATSRAVTERDQAREVADRLRAEEQKLRQAAVDPVTDDPQLAAQIARIEQLRTAMLTADQELAAAQKRANDELAGRPGKGLTGTPGYGAARIALDEEVRNAQKRYDDARIALARAEEQLGILRDKVAGAAQGKGQEASKRLEEVSRDRAAQERRLATLEERADALVRDREKLIRAAVEADASQGAARDGIGEAAFDVSLSVVSRLRRGCRSWGSGRCARHVQARSLPPLRSVQLRARFAGAAAGFERAASPHRQRDPTSRAWCAASTKRKETSCQTSLASSPTP